VDTVHECDRRTYRITITKTVQRRASHGKNRIGPIKKSITINRFFHGSLQVTVMAFLTVSARICFSRSAAAASRSAISAPFSINHHQYTLRDLLIRTWGPTGPQRYLQLYDRKPRHVVSDMIFNYLRQDVLRSVVFVGWLVHWCVLVCSLTCFGAEYLEDGWS